MGKKLICILIAMAMLFSTLPSLAQVPQAVRSDEPELPMTVACWDFEADPSEDGWLFVDSDGDGYNWHQTSEYALSGSMSISSSSYIPITNLTGTYLDPDNWAISPAVTVPEGTSALNFWGRFYTPTGYDVFRVYAGTSPDPESMQPLASSMSFKTNVFEMKSIDVSAYAGQTVYFAFRHANSVDGYKFYIDDVAVVSGVEPFAPAPENLVYGCYFDDDEEFVGWSMVDGNNDGFNWGRINLPAHCFEGVGIAYSESFINSTSGGGPVRPDNWLISPAITLPSDDLSVTFYAKGYDGIFDVYYKEHFTVYAGTSPDVDEMSVILAESETTNEYVQFTADLSAFAQQTVFIAIRHHNCYGENLICVDNFEVWGVGELPSEQNELIEEVAIEGFVVPAWGEAPFYGVTVPEGANYTIDTASWSYYDGSNWNYMQDGEVFDNEDYEYGMDIRLIPNEGYEFASEVTATINGGTELLLCTMPDQDGLRVVTREDFTVEREMIPAIEVFDLDIPEWGANPDFELSIPEDAHYYISELTWRSWENNVGTLLDESSVFESETLTYKLYLVLLPEEGYKFTPNTFGTLNGGTELISAQAYDDETDDYCIVSINFTVEREAIPAIEVFDLEIPEWGANPDFELSIPEDAHYYISELTWRSWENNVGTLLDESSVFESETLTYKLYLVLLPEEGYKFTPNTFGTLNGETELISAQAYDDETDYYCIVSIDFTVERELITEVAVEGFVEPVRDETPFYDVTVPEDANYTVGPAVWYCFNGEDTTVMAPDDTFVYGNTYWMEVELIPNDGYKFSADISGTVNGGEALVADVWTDGNENPDSAWIVTVEFTVEAPEIYDGIWGDANGDGFVDVIDAVLLLRFFIGEATVEEQYLPWCDVNGDGSVNIADALLVLRKAMGTVELFPVEE